MINHNNLNLASTRHTKLTWGVNLQNVWFQDQTIHIIILIKFTAKMIAIAETHYCDFLYIYCFLDNIRGQVPGSVRGG